MAEPLRRDAFSNGRRAGRFAPVGKASETCRTSAWPSHCDEMLFPMCVELADLRLLVKRFRDLPHIGMAEPLSEVVVIFWRYKGRMVSLCASVMSSLNWQATR